jgi:hypothetical protein
VVIPYFILGLSLLIAAFLIGRWFVNADPKLVARTMTKGAPWAIGIVTVVLLLALALTRRWSLAFLLLALFLPFLRRWRAAVQRVKAGRGPSSGQASEISTRFLKMTLDHDTGLMVGEVRDGKFAGWQLDELELVQLVELWRECQLHDRQSAAVLEAYLDRTVGDPWREAAGIEGMGASGGASGGAGADGAMSTEEALHILGLETGASPDEIREAHRRLMQKVHPDLGGSNYLAAKINQAKELLLGG